MNYQQIKTALSSLSLNQMHGINRAIKQAIEDAEQKLIDSVKMTKLPRGGYELKFKGKRYEVQYHAWQGRLRMYSRVAGAKPNTYKRGEVLINEWSFGTRWLRYYMALGTLETDKMMWERVHKMKMD